MASSEIKLQITFEISMNVTACQMQVIHFQLRGRKL